MTNSRYIVHSWPATLAGVLAAGAACSLLIADGWTNGFGLKHALPPICVVLTAFCGHLLWQALNEFKLISAAGLASLTAAGLIVVLYQSIGIQAASRDAQTIVAADQMATRDSLKIQLATIQQNLTWAMPDMLRECQGAPTPLPPTGWPICRSKRASVEAFEKRIDGLKTEIAGKPPVPVDPKADRVAGLLAALGVAMPEAAIKALVALFEPFMLPLFFEAGSLVLFGFGIRHVHVVQDTFPMTALSFEREDGKYDPKEIKDLRDINPPVKSPKLHSLELSEDERMIVEALRKIGGKVEKQGDIADLVGCHPGELSRRVQACRPGIVDWSKQGRNKSLSLGTLVAGHA